MDQIQAIERRISRRSFLDTPIQPELLQALKQKTNEINDESGLTISWEADAAAAFAGAKSYGMFSGVRGVFVLKGSKDLPHLKEKAGYYGEKLILEMTRLGLGSCWVGGTFDRDTGGGWAGQGEEIVCVVPVGHVREGGSFKEKLMRGMVHRKSKTAAEMFSSDTPPNEAFLRAMEMVRRAPTARNTQKVRFAQKEGTITASVPDDYPFDLVDLGICKLHFECGYGGRFEWGNAGALRGEQA